jgi:small-conductance mechanosensitive channel
LLLPLFLLGLFELQGQTSSATAQPQGSPSAQQQSAQPAQAPSGSGGEDIIPFLNQLIVWYRQLASQQQLATEPSDVLFLNDNRQLADQIVKLGFDYARARAQVIASQTASAAPDQNGGQSQYQRIVQAAARADQQVKNSQQEVARLQQKLETATAKQRRDLLAQIAETQSELDFAEARRDSLRGMVQFATGATAGGTGPGNLAAQIEELARAVPAATVAGKEAADAARQTNAANTAAATAKERKEEPTGMLGLISDLFDLRRKLHAVDDNIRQTEQLTQASRALRTPLTTTIRELTQKGDQLAAQPPATDPAVLAQQRKDLDAMTQQYKQLSASLLPLGKQNILLDVYKRSSTNWRNSVESQYQAELKSLILRLGGLAVILAVILGVSDLWKRATFRYVTDPRRRYQFLLLRRILMWVVILIVVVIAFASELGTITTFAGLMTAGIAVALQNVILSVAGYFFLIGKYGVRVGDRVQVAGITGDVVDIGLVRLHLMEVTGGSAPRPTGRVVVFSNAVVFQANAGLFKQIPGTSFVWHEVKVTLAPEGSYREVEKRMLEAVNKVFADYRDRMETQRLGMERALSTVRISNFAPESHLHLASGGLAVIIRYPVEISNAPEIDDRVTRELLDAIEREPRLRLLGSAGPEIKVEEQPA